MYGFYCKKRIDEIVMLWVGNLRVLLREFGYI